MKTKIILCTGGSRSGKSAFAERYTLAQKGQKIYIATAKIYDDEMADRVAQHKARRGSQWKNYEIPQSIAAQWREIAAEGDVMLIDCLTMYVTNYLMEYPDIEEECCRHQLRERVMQEMHDLIAQIQSIPDKTVIFVTNEVGLGIIPGDPMSRIFRDLAGEVNQYIAEVANEVYLSISGITVEIKGREVQIDG